MKTKGLELDGSNILLATVKRRKRSFVIQHLQTLQAPLTVKQLYKKRTPLVTGLASDEVLLKKLEFKGASKKILSKTLRYQLELENYLDPKETVALPFFNEEKEKTTVSFFLTSKDLLKKHLAACTLDPAIVSFTGQALFRFVEEYVHVENCFVLHLSQNGCHIAQIIRGELVRFHSLVGNKKSEIKKTFYSFLQEEKCEPLPLLVTGHVRRFPSLEDSLKEYYSHIIPIEKEEVKKLIPYALSIGLAIDGLAKDRKNVQFRKEEFTPKSVRTRLGKALFFTFFFSLALASALTYFGLQSYQMRKQALQETLEKIIAEDSRLMGRASVEKDLLSFKKTIKKEAKPSPFPLTVPSVREVFNWLEEEDIAWDSFHYELESFPKIHNQTDPYLVRVELKLSSKDNKKLAEYLTQKGAEEVVIKDEKLSFFLKQGNHAF
ncbi:MAG TPA: hypothetical protein VLG44_08120 [Chlamydiales bacterium]|nr:hypothetical protein [Chlamydiales bacterium]